jgi:hypothetical protein
MELYHYIFRPHTFASSSYNCLQILALGCVNEITTY